MTGIVLAFLASCSSAPELAPDEEPRIDAEMPVALTEDRAPFVAIDPGGLAGRVVGLRIHAHEAAAPDAAPIQSWERSIEDLQQAGGRLAFDLPVDGLEDGSRYRYRITLLLNRSAEYALAEEPVIELALGMQAPLPEPRTLITIDRAQGVRWIGAGDWPAASVRWRADATADWSTVDASVDGYRPDGPWLISNAISLHWEARFVSRTGVLGPWSETGRLRYAPDEAIPAARNHNLGGPSVVAVPGLMWHSIAGATSYDLQIGALPGNNPEQNASGGAVVGGEPGGAGSPETASVSLRDLEAVEEISSTEPRLRLTPGLLESLLAGQRDRSLYWRVRARAADGVTTPYSDLNHFVYSPMVGGLVTVVPRGASVSVRLGAAGSPEADERPEAVVVLRRPFEMQRTELTAEAVAAVVNLEIAAGRMILADDGVRSAAEDSRLYLGLDELTFGEQFTLERQASPESDAGTSGADVDGLIRPRDGYAGHPATGLSWFGSVAIANALSRLEAREEVYTGLTDPDRGLRADPTRAGYRLPAEAEWAAAATVGSRISSDETRVLVEARPLGPGELRGSNYLRSDDRWEDPVAPFTRRGGPTAPVGALGYANPIGLVDMIGNVWEWTADWYDPAWYRVLASGQVDQQRAVDGPVEPAPDVYGREQRAVRGLAWNSPRETLRPGNRGGFAPEATSHSIGLRLVRTLTGPGP